MLERIATHGFLHTGAHLGFFSGISMMLPVLTKAWELHIKPWLLSPYGFYVALALVLVSIVIIGFMAGSLSKLLRSVGWMLVIPGIIAVAFAAFGELQVYSWAQNHISGFMSVEPVVHFLVEHSVPKAAFMGAFYILVGICFVWAGRRLARVAQRI